MSLVLDASVTLRWRLAGKPDPLAEAALDHIGHDGAAAPAIWWYEVRNALLVNERHGKLEPAESTAFLDRLAHMPIQVDSDPDEALLLNLARRHGLSAYDAAYLELAARLASPLATLDRRLADAARRAGLALFEPGAP